MAKHNTNTRCYFRARTPILHRIVPFSSPTPVSDPGFHLPLSQHCGTGTFRYNTVTATGISNRTRTDLTPLDFCATHHQKTAEAGAGAAGRRRLNQSSCTWHLRSGLELPASDPSPSPHHPNAVVSTTWDFSRSSQYLMTIHTYVAQQLIPVLRSVEIDHSPLLPFCCRSQSSQP